MNLMILMVTGVAILLLQYMIQLRGGDGVTSTGRGQPGGNNTSGNSSTSKGGWFSPFSNLGAIEFFISTLFFSLFLGIRIPLPQGVVDLLGDSLGNVDLITRFALWVFVMIALQEQIKRWLSIEVIEAIAGPMLAILVSRLYEGGLPVLTHYIDFIARAFGVGIGGQ